VHPHIHAHRGAPRCTVGGKGDGDAGVKRVRVFFLRQRVSRAQLEPLLSVERRRRAVNHYLFLCFTLSSGGERNERGSGGIYGKGRGKRARESGRKSVGRGCFGERRALE